jgi:hypothetical protein
MRRAAWLCALLWLTGCAQFPWSARGVPVPVEQASAALAEIARAAAGRSSLRAMGRLELDAPAAAGGRVDELVLAQRPDRLRLESLSPLGQALTLLVTDGERYGWFDGARIESGEVTPSTLRERIGVALEPREAVDLLLAAPPLGSELPRAAFRTDTELWVLLDQWRLGIDPSGELAALEALEPGGRLRWRALYQGWRDVPGGRYPQALSLEFPRTRVALRLELSRVELNAALGPERFRIPARRSAASQGPE